jgi:hypothetical protein
MDSKTLVTSLFSGGAAGAIVSAVWGHISKLLLQKREEKSKEKLAALEAESKERLSKIESDLRLWQNVVQARVDRSVFVTKAHFDTEFEAMKNVADCLSKVRLAMNVLRPTLSIEPLVESDQERNQRLSERLGRLSNAFNSLLNESEAKAPFYSEELYIAITACLNVASLEIASIRTSGYQTLTDDWYERGEKNLQRFTKDYSTVTSIIRERISKLAILPDV